MLKSTNSRRRVVADENISINKEPTSNSLIALTAGFSSESLTTGGNEIRVVSEVGGIEHDNYILIRNPIITKWHENVSIWVTEDMFVDVKPEHCNGLLDSE